MKTSLLMLLAPLLALPAQAQVGLSLQLGQPGFYGLLNLGNAYPAPQLLYPQPLIVENRGGYYGQPAYLRVPPGHAKNWSKHCSRYGACNRPVYFVSDSWYENIYVPRYQRTYLDQKGADYYHPSKKPKKNKPYKGW
ncbi:hypothetical protein [Synechococcus sp. CCY 9618]|uniref:hypothetical protein n=1 Tax=Synechococcus sp. CCY 9618 TaxID=2815602 RepID=UPI001C2470DC|nr:hypothetical protein [Synechococcus sp. CCY 9618]